MLLMVEKGIRGVICPSINRYAKASNKYKKDYDKNIESSYLNYLGCKKFIWIDNVTKVTYEQFLMGSIYF